METKKTVCPLDCPDACGVVATGDGDRITAITGDKEHPFTKGFLCRKVSTYHERVHSPDRILHPMVRTGAKGSGQFSRISWDEAWDQLVSRLSRIRADHGGEALLPYSYAGNMGHISRTAGDPFFHRYGASRLKQTICSTAAKAGWSQHYGSRPAPPPEKALDAQLIIAWGINIRISNIHFWPLVMQARRRGARFVVIDPYRNETAAVADEHFAIRPGGDTSLALALFRLLREGGHHDEDFIREHTEGYEELSTLVENLSPDDLRADHGLSTDAEQNLAGLLRDHPRTFIRIGIGLTRNTRGAMSVRAITCLAASLGLFDGGKGRGALLSSGSFSGDSSRISFPEYRQEDVRAINMVQLGDALTTLDPPVKGLFVYNSNPLSVAPDASRVRRGLARDDLFTVVHEQFMTPTARYADLLLPATTSFENHDFYTGYGHFQAARTRPVIPARGEAISNFDLFQELGRRMGYQDKAFSQTIEERLDDYLVTVDGLPDPYRQQPLPADTVVSSSRLAGAGNFAVMEGKFRFQPPPFPGPGKEQDHPELTARFPFAMITPPGPDMLNSTFGERYPDRCGKVMIHPTDADARGIPDGAMVEVYNDRGRHRREAKVSDRTQPGLLILEQIYWESEASAGTGVNDLTSQAITDMGEGGTFHESRVNVRCLSS